MLAKIEIKGLIKVETGMHIGGSTQFAAIGAIDSPVIRDPYTKKPMIPGSSLKGKLRTLLVKSMVNSPVLPQHDEDPVQVKRLFGSAKKGDVKGSRLIFSDMTVANTEALKKLGINSVTEVKFENTINRATAVANPRQIERTIPGSEFELSIIYNCEKQDEIVEDISNLVSAMKLLEYDYLGGHGSRGYGKISFHNISTEIVVGDVEAVIMNQCKQIVEEI